MDISFYQFERLPPRCLYLTRTLFLYSFEPWNILDLKRSDIRCGQEFFIKKIYPNRVEYFYPRKRIFIARRNVNLRLICNQFCGIKLTHHARTRNISLSLGDEITREGTRKGRDENLQFRLGVNPETTLFPFCPNAWHAEKEEESKSPEWSGDATCPLTRQDRRKLHDTRESRIYIYIFARLAAYSFVGIG